MAETSIDFIHGENTVVWSSDYFTVIRTMEEYLKNYPDEVSIVSDSYDTDGQNRCLTIKVPAKWMRNPKPPRSHNMTEEQKEAAKERGRHMAKVRMNKMNKKSE